MQIFNLYIYNFRATQTASKKYEEESAAPAPIKMQDVKAARLLASEITQSGAKLYDLMEHESVDRVERSRALRFLDQAASTSGERKLEYFYCTVSSNVVIIMSLLLLLLLFVDGPREQAYIERSIRDIIENTKQSLEDMR